MRINDVTSGVVLLVFSIVLWTSARGLANPANQLYGPAFFPEWIAIAMGIAATVMIVTSRKQVGSQPFVSFDGWMRDPRRVMQFLLVPAAVIFYVYTVGELGFVLAAALVLACMLLALGVRVKVAAPTTVGVILLIYLIFVILLRVPLPRGALFFD